MAARSTAVKSGGNGHSAVTSSANARLVLQVSDADEERTPHKRRASCPPVAAVLASPAFPAALDFAALTGAAVFAGAPRDVALPWVGVSVVIFAASGSYQWRLTPRLQGEVVAIIAIPALAVALAILGSHHDSTFVLRLLVAAFILVAAGRVVSCLLQRKARVHYQLPTVIIGSGHIAQTIARAIAEHPGFGLELLGTIDAFPDTSAPVLEEQRVLGDLDDLPSLIERHDIRRVIVAFGGHPDTAIVDVLRRCHFPGVGVYVIPRLFEVGMSGGRANGDELWGFPLLRASRSALRKPSWRAKRLLDLVFSAVVLVVVSPIIGLGALAVKLGTPGPVFFKQTRVGQRGRVVEVLKLRTMPVLPDSDTQWTVAETTVGRVGRIMRLASIDELPQLWNVLRGDMSLVGPRPERPHFVAKFSEEVERYNDRHRVPVGLTGWAQIHGLRGDTSIEDRARFDNFYIEHWSLWLDLVIIARTVIHVVRTVCGWGRPANRLPGAEPVAASGVDGDGAPPTRHLDRVQGELLSDSRGA